MVRRLKKYFVLHFLPCVCSAKTRISQMKCHGWWRHYMRRYYFHARRYGIFILYMWFKFFAFSLCTLIRWSFYCIWSLLMEPQLYFLFWLSEYGLNIEIDLLWKFPTVDRHVNELWLFPIFLDCVGYQQDFCPKIVAIKIHSKTPIPSVTY